MLKNNTVFLTLKMFLGGAYADQNPLMRDDLRKQGLLPLSDPYFTDPQLIAKYLPSAGHANSQVDNALFADKGEKSIVDWVWIQLHDAGDPCKIVATQTGYYREMVLWWLPMNILP